MPALIERVVESSNAEALEDGADFGGAGGFGGWFGAGAEEGFDGSGVVSGGAMPAVFGTVNGPAEGSAIEVVAVVFEAGFVGKEQLNGVDVAVPGGPVKRGGVVLAACGDRKAGFEEEAQGDVVVVAGGVRDVTKFAGGEGTDDVGIFGENGIECGFVVKPGRVEEFY